MSHCGYYEIVKGNSVCKHPTYGEEKTQLFKGCGAKYFPCDVCKRRCFGIYPSQVPKAELNCKQDIIDKDGNVIG